ncbi:MAG: hypothetical protein K0U15_06610 [Proteobacteria bacterium]|nr:hypothetical protein [Pseudomonadota bacterium]
MGALLLISVVPITLIAIKPINDILLAPDNAPNSLETGWGISIGYARLLVKFPFFCI